MKINDFFAQLLIHTDYDVEQVMFDNQMLIKAIIADEVIYFRTNYQITFYYKQDGSDSKIYPSTFARFNSVGRRTRYLRHSSIYRKISTTTEFQTILKLFTDSFEKEVS